MDELINYINSISDKDIAILTFIIWLSTQGEIPRDSRPWPFSFTRGEVIEYYTYLWLFFNFIFLFQERITQ